MTREQIKAIDDALALAHERMRNKVMECVGVCDGATLILWMTEHLSARRLFDAPLACAVNQNTLATAWDRAAAPSRAAIRRHIKLVRLRHLCDVPGISFAAAAVSGGFEAQQAAHRVVRDTTGLSGAAWRESTTALGVTASFASFCTEHADAIRRFRVPRGAITRRTLRARVAA